MKPIDGVTSECLFCNGKERNYKPDPFIYFICGTCVVLMLNTPQDKLRYFYGIATDKGTERQAWAIESFLTEEER